MVALVILDPRKTGMKKVGAVVELGYGKKDSKQINGDRDVGDMLVDDLPGKNTKKVLENKRAFLYIIQDMGLNLFCKPVICRNIPRSRSHGYYLGAGNSSYSHLGNKCLPQRRLCLQALWTSRKG